MTPEEFVSIYPTFIDVSDTDIQAQLDAFALIYKGSYGGLADHLTGLYVAHQVTVFTLNTGSGAQQNVTSRSVADMSWNYDKSSNSDKAGDFASTKYGLEFFRLMSMFGHGPIMAGVST
jgi:hypothetical protein